MMEEIGANNTEERKRLDICAYTESSHMERESIKTRLFILVDHSPKSDRIVPWGLVLLFSTQ